jgi:Concanavalin A-like lectin/glucanases superfamily
VPQWHDAAYNRRTSVGLCDSAAPDASVDGLPVTVVLRAADFDFASTHNNGLDVVFVDHRGTAAGTLLSFERAEFRDGYALFFVRIDAFNPHDLGDAIWLYYDRASPPNRQDANATWTDFNGVWHFDDEDDVGREARGASLQDVGNSTYWDDGAPLYGSLDLVGNGDSFMAGPPGGARIDNGAVSFMVGPNSGGTMSNGHGIVIDRWNGSGGFDNDTLHVTLDYGTRVGVSRPNNGSGTYLLLSADGARPNNAFCVISASWTPTQIDLFVNGASVGSVAHTAQPFQSSGNYVAAQVLMGLVSNANGNIAARLDEIRVSNTARSAAYVRAEAHAHLEQLLQFGVVEQR